MEEKPVEDSTTRHFPSEHVLEDDYPIYNGYWYVVDGTPLRPSDMVIVTNVRDLKAALGVSIITNCDLRARRMLQDFI